MRKQIIRFCDEKREKKKYGNIRVTYEELLWQAAGKNENRQSEIQTEHLREFQHLLEELVAEHILSPVKNSKKAGYVEHVYEKYLIIGEPRKQETDKEFITRLHSYIGTQVFAYYHYRKKEFEKDKKAIDIIYHYYRKSHKERLTANELGYYLFGDEKAFEQPDEGGIYTRILNRMGLNLEQDLNAYYTREPFFCQIKQSFFQKDKRMILIVENKDTYFRLKNHEVTKEYDCVIFGEGWKIVSSFSLAEETGIKKTDVIEYFGDIDPEGFLIYQKLKYSFSEYDIHLQKEFYRQTLKVIGGKTPGKIKGCVREETLCEACQIVEELEWEDAAYIKEMMRQGRYLPQEATVISLLHLS